MKVYIGPYVEDDERRQVEIELHDYDIWNFDHTLAMIILPGLRMLKEAKHGTPYIDDADVPEELRSTSAPPELTKDGVDENFDKRWQWVLDEMIWAFETEYVKGDGDEYYFDPYEPDEKVEPFTINVLDENGSVEEAQFSPESRRELGKYNPEKHAAYSARLKHAMYLFGRYFGALWT